MTNSPRIMLFAAGAAMAIVVLLVCAAALFVHVNARPRLAAIASEALGMEVRIEGPVAIRIFPSLHVVLQDVHVGQPAQQVASAGEIDLGIELLPLLHDEVRADRIELKRLTLLIERHRAGRDDVDASFATGGTLAALTATRVSASDATLSYADKLSGESLTAAGCQLEMSHLRLSSGRNSDVLKHLSFAATLDCGQIRSKNFAVSDLKLSVEGQSGDYSISPMTMRLFDGQGSGDVHADLSGAVPVYRVRYHLTQFSLEDFFSNVSPKSIGSGRMDFSAALSLRGRTTNELLPSLEGLASLHGNDLTLQVGDLDAKLARYESSQSFNLIDFGAFFFAGPLALAVTKGYDYARIFQGAAGTTRILTLASEWRVDHGMAQATDVAMATPKNRIALKGGLDFVSGRYDRVTVAVLNARGCAIVQQKVDGPFLNPTLQKPNMLGSITGPARTLLRQAASLLGAKCEPFYTGSVAPPT